MQPERDVRVKRAQRGQITWGRVDLDAEVPADHEVRAIAAVVDKLDLRELYADVRARGEIAKQIYKERAATAETVNADAKAHRGMAATALRGLAKVTGNACRFALTYNILRFITVSA